MNDELQVSLDDLKSLFRENESIPDLTLLKRAKYILGKYKPEECFGHQLLHSACSNRVSIDIVRLLLDYDKGNMMLFEEGEDGRLPLHDACNAAGAQVEIIQLLLDHDLDKRSILKKDHDDYLPLHDACDGNAPVEVIKLLLHLDLEKKSLFERDGDGNLPIHRAFSRHAPVEVIRLLLEHDLEKRTIFEKDQNGRLLLHLACYCNHPMELIQHLLDHDHKKKSLLEEDTYGYLPIHFACLRNAQVVVIKYLLHHWTTQTMKNYFKNTPVYEMKIDRYISTLPLVTPGDKEHAPPKVVNFIEHCKLIERTTLLELAIKKSKCSHGVMVIIKRVLDFN